MRSFLHGYTNASTIDIEVPMSLAPPERSLKEINPDAAKRQGERLAARASGRSRSPRFVAVLSYGNDRMEAAAGRRNSRVATVSPLACKPIAGTADSR